MPIPQRPHFATGQSELRVQVTDDGSRTLLWSDGDRFRDVAFHSGCGAIAETRDVYLVNSGVADRLRRGRATTVLEIGLGTAMAALMTIDSAIRGNASLDYVAIDQRFPRAPTLRQLEPWDWVTTPGLVDAFLSWWSDTIDPAGQGVSEFCWNATDHQRLRIIRGDASRWSPGVGRFNAVYFDPFAPEVSPGLWSDAMLSRMAAALGIGGTLATYCVKGHVRRSLQSAGLLVRRVPGPAGGKREVLTATRLPDDPN